MTTRQENSIFRDSHFYIMKNIVAYVLVLSCLVISLPRTNSSALDIFSSPDESSCAVNITTEEVQRPMATKLMQFWINAPNAQGEKEDFMIVVYVGQRISDAADDFARRLNLPPSDFMNANVFQQICNPSINAFECVSMESNSIIRELTVSNMNNMVIFVRRGYSATQQAIFACMHYNCSNADYMSLRETIKGVMKKAVYDIFNYEPFALLEGPSMSHMLTYCLFAMQDDDMVKLFCKNVNKICEISSFCPQAGYLNQMLSFCSLLFDNDGTGSSFFRLFQSAYNTPNSTLVPTREFLEVGVLSGYVVKSLGSTRVGFANLFNILYSTVINRYRHESFSPYAGASVVYGDDSSVDLISRTNFISKSKIQFHIKQLEYLADQAKAHFLHINANSSRPEFRSHDALRKYFSDLVEKLKIVKHALGNISYSLVVYDNLSEEMLASSLYNRFMYQRPFFPDRDALEIMSRPKLNPLTEEAIASINHKYVTDHLVVVDNFLQPDVLEELYEYCVESTIWHVADKSLFVGSYWQNGLNHPLILSIAEEIGAVFPFVRNLPLIQMWAYNFDNSEPKANHLEGGIGMHMDAAIVNLNLWITPDEANLDPESGGLIVWMKHLFSPGNNPHGKKYTFKEVQDLYFGREFLKGSEHLNFTVPYRQNRVVIFDSDLWHATDVYNFAKGHRNRRINLTFLFGENDKILKNVRSAYESRKNELFLF